MKRVANAIISSCGSFCAVSFEDPSGASNGHVYRVTLGNYTEICDQEEISKISPLFFNPIKLSRSGSSHGLIEFCDIIYLARKRMLRTKLSAIIFCILRTDVSKPLDSEARRVAIKINDSLKNMQDFIANDDMFAVLRKTSDKTDVTKVFAEKLENLLKMSSSEGFGHIYCFICQMMDTVDRIKEETATT